MIMVTIYIYFKEINKVKLLACRAWHSGSFVNYNEKVLRKWDRS
jgi:hypothetical protein